MTQQDMIPTARTARAARRRRPKAGMSMDTLQRDARRALNDFGLTVAACSLDALIEETGIDVSMQQYVDALT
jgi:hypothetical protein